MKQSYRSKSMLCKDKGEEQLQLRK